MLTAQKRVCVSARYWRIEPNGGVRRGCAGE